MNTKVMILNYYSLLRIHSIITPFHNSCIFLPQVLYYYQCPHNFLALIISWFPKLAFHSPFWSCWTLFLAKYKKNICKATILTRNSKIHTNSFIRGHLRRSSSCYSQFLLAFAPKFTKQPLAENQFATKEGNTTILCKPEAAPKPTITWQKDGRLISENDRVRVMPNGNLYISSVRPEDGGVYKCESKNDLGEASSQGNLTILGIAIAINKLRKQNHKKRNLQTVYLILRRHGRRKLQ